MNDYVSLLLQGCAAKRKLAELFQSEGFGQENQPPIAIAAQESVPSVQSGIRQTSDVASTGLFVIGFCYGRVSQAKRNET
jgi:hypothetical protein